MSPSSSELGEAYLKFVNIGRAIQSPPHVLNLRVGQVELDIPFTQSKSIWFINQNTSGTAQANNNSYLPTATGSNFGGVGIASDANFKDIYTSFNYRFNLEKYKESRNSIQAAEPSGPRDHTYLNFGTYWLYGRPVQRLTGATAGGASATLTAREPFYRVGGNFTLNDRCCLQFNGLYMYGHDYNLLPVDSTVVLSQKGLMFHPHVLVVQQGTTVELRTTTPCSTTYSGRLWAPTRRVAIIWALGPRAKSALSSSIRPVWYRCCANVHPEMSGYIVVTPHRTSCRLTAVETTKSTTFLMASTTSLHGIKI